jgi:hypothetical protein
LPCSPAVRRQLRMSTLPRPKVICRVETAWLSMAPWPRTAPYRAPATCNATRARIAWRLTGSARRAEPAKYGPAAVRKSMRPSVGAMGERMGTSARPPPRVSVLRWKGSVRPVLSVEVGPARAAQARAFASTIPATLVTRVKVGEIAAAVASARAFRPAGRALNGTPLPSCAPACPIRVPRYAARQGRIAKRRMALPAASLAFIHAPRFSAPATRTASSKTASARAKRIPIRARPCFVLLANQVGPRS